MNFTMFADFSLFCLLSSKKQWSHPTNHSKKCSPTLDDIVSPFDRPLTLIHVFNIVYFTLKYLRSSRYFSFYSFCQWIVASRQRASVYDDVAVSSIRSKEN